MPFYITQETHLKYVIAEQIMIDKATAERRQWFAVFLSYFDVILSHILYKYFLCNARQT